MKQFTILSIGMFAGTSLFLCVRVAASEGIRSSLFPLPLPANAPDDFNRSKEPALGGALPFKAASTHESAQPILVVFAGDCSSCSLRGFNPVDVDTSKYSHVYVVYRGKKLHLPRFPASTAENVTFIADESGRVGSALNARWSPRFYLYSSDGKLLTFQDRPGNSCSFVAYKGDVK